MRVVVVGAGSVGARTVRQLTSSRSVEQILVVDADPARASACANAMAQPDRVAAGPAGSVWWEAGDVAVLAGPAAEHRGWAERGLEAGASVVSVADSVAAVRSLLALDGEARARGLAVVVGAGFAPGLSDVLAAHAATGLDSVDEVHVARVGAGGPACARQRHLALANEALDWRDGAWVARPGSSGRELNWFPDPVGAVDCYRAALADPLLLVPAFHHASRITARMGANRRDRLTARLPMLRPPHPEGGVGAIRVEVRGARGRARDVVVFGAIDRPGVAAGAVAAVTAVEAGEGRIGPGAAGLASSVAPLPFLAELARRGVKSAVFEGSAQVAASSSVLEPSS